MYKKDSFNWFVKISSTVFSYFISKIKFDVEKYRKFQQEGSIIFVFYSFSFIDYIILYYHLKENNLKLPLMLYHPLPRFYSVYKKIFRSKDEDVAGLIKDAIKNDVPVAAFLQYHKNDNFIFDILLSLQKEKGNKIKLVPTQLLWHKRPQGKKNIFDIILGSANSIGFVRKVLFFLRNFKRAFIHIGEPLDLENFINDNNNLPAETKIKKLRLVLRYNLARELRTILGPAKWPRKYLIKKILNEDYVKDEMIEIARSSNTSLAKVNKKAYKYLMEIAAEYTYGYIEFMDVVLTWLFNSIYDGIIYDKNEMDILREKNKNGSLLLMPSHRSHLDYLILDYIFYHENMLLPYIAAGINLSFFPLGNLFRNVGAFFIRRSFKGNKLYAKSFSAYTDFLLNEGFNVEFFIEGTRSRTGKLMPPKLGMLKIIIMSITKGLKKDVTVVPIGFTYEVIIEGESYEKELKGGTKEKENVSGLVKATKVLKKKYGNVYVKILEPVNLSEMVLNEKLQDKEQNEVNEFIERTGYYIINKIGDALTATPTAIIAAAFLISKEKGVEETLLYSNVKLILKILQDRNVELTRTLDRLKESYDKVIERFKKEKILEEFEEDNELIFVAKEEKRITLDYYKNNIIHFLAELSFVENALFLAGDVWDNFLFLTNIFKDEFNWKFKKFKREDFELNKKYIENNFDLEEKGMLGRIIINFIESYFVVYSTIISLGENELTDKELLGAIINNGKKQLIKGTLWRPESFSKTNFQVSLKSLIDSGILETRKGKVSNKVVITDKSIVVLQDRNNKLRELINKNKNE